MVTLVFPPFFCGGATFYHKHLDLSSTFSEKFEHFFVIFTAKVGKYPTKKQNPLAKPLTMRYNIYCRTIIPNLNLQIHEQRRSYVPFSKRRRRRAKTNPSANSRHFARIGLRSGPPDRRIPTFGGSNLHSRSLQCARTHRKDRSRVPLIHSGSRLSGYKITKRLYKVTT